MEKQPAQRIYYIDWLRIIAVALLIPFHTSMIFVTWDFHIKNDVLSPGLTWFNTFLGFWHMPLFMFLAGVGTWHALGFRSGGAYARERLLRLLLPLVFGMLVVIPPQVYVERIWRHQFTGSYFAFYPHVFNGTYPEGNLSWHHLWFLLYLFLNSLIALPLFLAMRRAGARDKVERAMDFFSRGAAAYLPALPLILGMWLFRNTWPNGDQNLFGDLDNFTLYLVVFVYGYALSFSRAFWETAERQRFQSLGLGLAAIAGAFWMSETMDTDIIAVGAVFLVFHGIATWCMLMALAGFAKKHLNAGGAAHRYASEAALPFYILHQTLIIIIGYFVIRTHAGVAVKFTLIMAGAFASTIAIYDVFVKRIGVLRFLFGMRPAKKKMQG